MEQTNEASTSRITLEHCSESKYFDDKVKTSTVDGKEKAVILAEEKVDRVDDAKAQDAARQEIEDYNDEGKEDVQMISDVCRDTCLICLGEIEDQSVLPTCKHSLFCFACIVRWIGIHRRCPLCSTSIGSYIIHSIRSDTDYVRHNLPQLCGIENRKALSNAANDTFEAERDPLRVQAETVSRRFGRSSGFSQHTERLRLREARKESGADRDFRQDAIERWERQLTVRRRVYRQALYCQHVGSNRRSRLSPPPTPHKIAQTPSLQQHLLKFVRRELIAFPASNLDIDFLATYTINVMRTLDIKSDESVTLLSDFMTVQGAQHFCHEVYSFARFIAAGAGSFPDKLAAFDAWASYDWPEHRFKARSFAAIECQGNIKRERRVNGDADEDVADTATTLAAEKPSDNESKDAEQIDQSDFVRTANFRADVIQRRAKLLARLEAQRDQQKQEVMLDCAASLDDREQRLRKLLHRKRETRTSVEMHDSDKRRKVE